MLIVIYIIILKCSVNNLFDGTCNNRDKKYIKLFNIESERGKNYEILTGNQGKWNFWMKNL